MAEDESSVVLSFCNACGRRNRHRILHCHKASRQDGDGDSVRRWEEAWDLLECCGCHTIKARCSLRYPEFPEPQVDDYPPIETRRCPAWLARLPEELQQLMFEVYRALNTDGRRLAAMGARSLVEMTMVEKVGDQGSFARNLTAMETEGYLSRREKSILEAALEAGHAATHRGHNPTSEELEQVMDIVEHLLRMVYALEESSAMLRRRIPPRRRSAGEGTANGA